MSLMNYEQLYKELQIEYNQLKSKMILFNTNINSLL